MLHIFDVVNGTLYQMLFKQKAAAACVIVILHIACPTENVAELWTPVETMTPILEKYSCKPGLGAVVQYFVEGVPKRVPINFKITFGTMCSGTDYISEVFHQVCHAFCQRLGNSCRLSLQHLFAVENNKDMQKWCKLQARELDFHPKIYQDMNRLPLQDMPGCDVLFAGTSCKGLSSLNTKQRSIADVDPTNTLCSSGNTMKGRCCCINGR